MKIAYVGDSFCAHSGPDDWTSLVAEELDAEIIQTGFGGKNFYSAIEKFLPKMFEADIIVCFVTEPYRIFNRWDLPLNMTWREEMLAESGEHWERRHEYIPKKQVPMLLKAVDFYYKYLFDNGFAEFYNIGCVSLFDELIKHCDKKIMWFPCFYESFQFSETMQTIVDNSKERNILYPYITNKLPSDDLVLAANYIPISGPSANIPLQEISIMEVSHMVPRIRDAYLHKDPRSNHFNQENHYKMTELIVDIIKNDKFSPDVIKMEDYFPHMNFSRTKVVR
jgi:hypothetical protein